MTTSRVLNALTFGSDPSQTGDLYLPGRMGSLEPPVVCLLHGGFWRMPYGRDQMAPLAEDLAARGYAVWNLEYRRLGGGGGWPVTLEDVSAGVDHLAVLRAEGIDFNLHRVVTVGHSAGGHLALWVAGRHRDSENASQVRVTAAVGLAPAADLRRVHELRLSNDVVLELLGGSPSEFPERYRMASPRALLPLGVPQLIVHGDADDTVPVEIGREYARVARASGDSVDYVELPGVGHYEHLDATSAAWGAVTSWLERTVPPG